MTAPRLAAQFERSADLTPVRGQSAWFWRGAGLDLVRCIGCSLMYSPAGDIVVWSVVLGGRVLIVPADRLTPVPKADHDFASPAAP